MHACLKYTKKVAILHTTGSPQGTGFPSTSGLNSGTFGAAIRKALKGLGNFVETLTFFLRVPATKNFTRTYYWPEGFPDNNLLLAGRVPDNNVILNV